jgi:hypothetical protein
MAYFVGFAALDDMLQSHKDRTTPVYVAPWRNPNTGPETEYVLVSDVQDGVGRYCLLPSEQVRGSIAASETETPLDRVRRHIEQRFGLPVEPAAISLPALHLLRLAGDAGVLTVGASEVLPPSASGLIDDTAQRRYEAIRPLIKSHGRDQSAVKARAAEVGVGVSTLYAWLSRYDPRIGPRSLSGSRRRRFPGSGGGREGESSKDGPDPAYWLRGETPDNWIADKCAQFRLVGIEEQNRHLAESVRPGDIVITYVRGRFADLRRVQAQGLVPLGEQVRYTDGVLSYGLRTEPLAVLPFDQHVPARAIVNVVPMLQSVRGRRASTKGMLRQLGPQEGRIIEQALLARVA